MVFPEQNDEKKEKNPYRIPNFNSRNFIYVSSDLPNIDQSTNIKSETIQVHKIRNLIS